MAKPGRPAFRPTAEQRRTVESMTAYGIPQVDIGRVVGIDDETFRKHFREEIDTGVARANTRVAAFLFETATGQRGEGSAAVTAAIFWMKTRGRWKEITGIEYAGKDGGPIAMSLAEREAKALEALRKAFAEVEQSKRQET